MTDDIDEDAMMAALDLVGRTGATGIEFGYLNDNVPIRDADWYAHAQYRGSRVTVEHHPGPVEALEALARRLLRDGTCTHCGRTITLSTISGRIRCKWTRHGAKWVRGCAERLP